MLLSLNQNKYASNTVAVESVDIVAKYGRVIGEYRSGKFISYGQEYAACLPLHYMTLLFMPDRVDCHKHTTGRLYKKNYADEMLMKFNDTSIKVKRMGMKWNVSMIVSNQVELRPANHEVSLTMEVTLKNIKSAGESISMRCVFRNARQYDGLHDCIIVCDS